MSDLIFHIDENAQITRLESQPYDSEALLQELLARFPEVLGSAAGDTSELLLIRREKSVPGEDGGGGRWALDHLFVDVNAVPVLVEVKRASDTRARREVVAQMLDYAANGVAYWPLSEFVEAFESTCESAGETPEDVLSSFIQGTWEPHEFWRQVEANLKAGRIRMVFVAEIIGRELRRIVEFLNEQMRPAEVLAIEVAQFTAEGGGRTLVPRLVGDTARAEAAKSVTGENEKSRWYRNYWETLVSTQEATFPLMAMGRDSRSNWKSFRLAPKHFHLSAVLFDGEIFAQVALNGPDSENEFLWLQARKDAIENELAEELGWDHHAGKVWQYIYMSKDDVDIGDEAQWPAQHQWLAESLTRLHQVFQPYLQELSPELWR